VKVSLLSVDMCRAAGETCSVSSRVGAALAEIFRPAVEPLFSAGPVALAALRVLTGLLWLYNVAWKRPPDFGENSGQGLYGFTEAAVEYPVFPPYSWIVEHLVLPHIGVFGWMVLTVETLLAVLLLTGTLVRVAALLGVGQSLAIGLSVAQAPGEWPWAYWMMIGIHLVLLFTASGRVAAVDAVRAEARPHRGRAARRLVLGWGALFCATSVWALVLAAGDDPWGSSGARLGGPDFSVSLGSYNVAGAGVLLVVGALMLLAATAGRRALAWSAAVVALVAAVTLYAQLSRADVWLGGSNTSAAFLLCAVVVSAMTANSLQAPTSKGTVPHGAA
jgi:hypothetical protein